MGKQSVKMRIWDLLSLLPPGLLLASSGTPLVHGITRDTCKTKDHMTDLDGKGIERRKKTGLITHDWVLLRRRDEDDSVASLGLERCKCEGGTHCFVYILFIWALGLGLICGPST